MHLWTEAISDFRKFRADQVALARQRAAFQLLTGCDLDLALSQGGAVLQNIVARTERLLERERMKGCRRHWSYDLNRHIALKQALDRLRCATARNHISQDAEDLRDLEAFRRSSTRVTTIRQTQSFAEQKKSEMQPKNLEQYDQIWS